MYTRERERVTSNIELGKIQWMSDTLMTYFSFFGGCYFIQQKTDIYIYIYVFHPRCCWVESCLMPILGELNTPMSEITRCCLKQGKTSKNTCFQVLGLLVMCYFPTRRSLLPHGFNGGFGFPMVDHGFNVWPGNLVGPVGRWLCGRCRRIGPTSTFGRRPCPATRTWSWCRLAVFLGREERAQLGSLRRILTWRV